MDKILELLCNRWQGVAVINLFWVCWFMVYLFLWFPKEESISLVFYGLSVIPFAILVVVGTLGAYKVLGGRG